MSSYHEHPVRPALRGPVTCVWVRLVEPGDTPTLVVPDGCVDLIRWKDELIVVGPDTTARSVPVQPGDGIAGIRFNPGGAPLLLRGAPVSELRDLQVSLEDLWGGRAARALLGRVATAGRRPLAEARVLEHEMLSLLPDHSGDRLLAAAVHALDQPDPPPVGALARTLGLSERQLRRRCTADVGYGPKTLESVLRFRRAMRLADGHSGLAEIASLAGYADQAHLSREVKRLSGRTAGALLRNA